MTRPARRPPSALRTVVFVLLIGAGGAFVGSALDGDWPPWREWSATHWIVLVAGWSVIGAGSYLSERRLARRRASRADVGEDVSGPADVSGHQRGLRQE